MGYVDVVMMGRAAYQTPYLLADVDRRFFGSSGPMPTRAAALRGILAHTREHLARGGRLNNVVRHTLGLMHGMRGARQFRRYFSENAVGDRAGIEVLLTAIDMVERAETWQRDAVAQDA